MWAGCERCRLRNELCVCVCVCVCVSCRYDTLPANDAHLQRIADHVSAYLQIVRSQLLATIPKAIVHCMVSSKLPHPSALAASIHKHTHADNI